MIDKLMRIADLKEELNELEQKVNTTRNEKYSTKAVELMNAAFDQFGDWFSAKGFTIEKGDKSSTAVYKTEKLTLGKGHRDWFLSLAVNGKEIGTISIGETRNTKISSGGTYSSGGSDEQSREISILSQRIETAKRDLSRVNDLEFCYVIESPRDQTRLGEEYATFAGVLQNLLK